MTPSVKAVARILNCAACKSSRSEHCANLAGLQGVWLRCGLTAPNLIWRWRIAGSPGRRELVRVRSRDRLGPCERRLYQGASAGHRTRSRVPAGTASRRTRCRRVGRSANQVFRSAEQCLECRCDRDTVQAHHWSDSDHSSGTAPRASERQLFHDRFAHDRQQQASCYRLVRPQSTALRAVLGPSWWHGGRGRFSRVRHESRPAQRAVQRNHLDSERVQQQHRRQRS